MRSPPDLQGLFAAATVMTCKSRSLTGFSLAPTKKAVSWNVQRWSLSSTLGTLTRPHSYTHFLYLQLYLGLYLDALSLVHTYVSTS
jgi:hypothetical protein